MDYWHRAWSCPYFVWDEKLKMGCEGGRLIFPDKKCALSFLDKYCAGDWKSCPIACGINDYYERKEQHDKERSRRKG